jgi:pimeloyl-ACP methyl ester carboxylesterase
MIHVRPNVQAQGQGPAVILLHSSGGSARQWDTLVNGLQSRFRLQAVDFHGHGGTPAWPGTRPLALEDEAALVSPLLAGSGDGVHLVGHSYGGAVALKLAQLHPQHVRSVAVYEPVLFRLLFDYNASHAPAREVLAAAARVRTMLLLGHADRAAQHFVDYWSGSGTWADMPLSRRHAVIARMPALAPHFRALFSDGLRRQDLGRLRLPVLCLTGARTKASTRRIGELLRLAIPEATHEMLPGMGHMGPLTHARIVAARIAGWLDAQAMLQDAVQRLRVAA